MTARQQTDISEQRADVAGVTHRWLQRGADGPAVVLVGGSRRRKPIAYGSWPIREVRRPSSSACRGPCCAPRQELGVAPARFRRLEIER